MIKLRNNYPHFDAPISPEKIKELVQDSGLVAKNSFFPFLSYDQSWTRYGSDQPKTRPIRYASRRDAYIYAHYRKILSELYEGELIRLGISEVPIAYRSISKPNSKSGKSNIDFAKDGFDEIANQQNCVVIALDISSYFDCLDHEQIYRIWARLLRVKVLPRDHNAVYKSITNYSYVDRNELYCRLGYSKKIRKQNKHIYQYQLDPRKIPKKLCSGSDFRLKVCGKGRSFSKLISKNRCNHGIPQGSPISDVIANFYLIDFDLEIANLASKVGGKYMRYSDDLLFIYPTSAFQSPKEAEDIISSTIHKYGSQIKIKKEKTSIVEYRKSGQTQIYTHVSGGQGKNGIEYLGFRYDGCNVYIRDKTISSFYRKVSYAIKAQVAQLIEMNPEKDVESLVRDFDYSRLTKTFLRAQRDHYRVDEYRTWTFWTYLKRSENTFGEKGKPILAQVSGFRSFITKKVKERIVSHVKKMRRKQK